MRNLYPGAGLAVHPGVKAAIDTFRRLPEALRERTPLLYWLLGSGTPPYKMDKVDADYGPPLVQGQTCGNCRFAWQSVTRPGEFICSQIDGDIRPEDWCRLWEGP